jgi:hypothetical protein
MFLILPAGQGKRIGVKGLGGFVCSVSGSRVRLEIGQRKYGLEVCDGTLKEGMFRSETSKGSLPDSEKRTGARRMFGR